jgi:chaperonin GroES
MYLTLRWCLYVCAPCSGTVVRVGPGKFDPEAEGKRGAMKLKEGDKVLYFKYAGDAMETPKGEKFTVLREDDVLCKAL